LTSAALNSAVSFVINARAVRGAYRSDARLKAWQWAEAEDGGPAWDAMAGVLQQSGHLSAVITAEAQPSRLPASINC
jgi:hypothetical protein